MPCYSEKEYIWSCIIIYFKIDLDIYTQDLHLKLAVFCLQIFQLNSKQL